MGRRSGRLSHIKRPNFAHKTTLREERLVGARQPYAREKALVTCKRAKGRGRYRLSVKSYTRENCPRLKRAIAPDEEKSISTRRMIEIDSGTLALTAKERRYQSRVEIEKRLFG